MSVCAVKRGFFTLRDCGAPAAAACSVCSRFVCSEHSLQEGSSLLCVDCHARRTEQAAVAQASDRNWSIARRHNYYTSGSYRPFYWGSAYDHYYDDYDVRSFDRDEPEPDFAEEHGSAGFLDS